MNATLFHRRQVSGRNLPFLCKVHNSPIFSRQMFVQIDEKKFLKTS